MRVHTTAADSVLTKSCEYSAGTEVKLSAICSLIAAAAATMCCSAKEACAVIKVCNAILKHHSEAMLQLCTVPS